MCQVRRPKVDFVRDDQKLQAVNTCSLKHNLSPSLSDSWWQLKTHREIRKMLFWRRNCLGFRLYRAFWKGVCFYLMPYIKCDVPRRVRSARLCCGLASLCVWRMLHKKIMEIGLWALMYLLTQVPSFQNENFSCQVLKVGQQEHFSCFWVRQKIQVDVSHG